MTYTQEQVDEMLAGIKAKNEELLAEVKKTKAELRTVKNPEVSVDQYNQLQESFEQLKSEHSNFIKQNKAYETTVSSLTEKLQSAEKAIQIKTIGEEFSKAFDTINIAPHFREAVSAMFQSRAVFDNGTVKIEDKPANEFFNSWAATDVAKHFISAANNTGSGAPPKQSSSTSVKSISVEDFQKLSPAEKLVFFKDGGNLK